MPLRTPPTLGWMRIPSGDLVPARRRRYDGGYGRRRRRRNRRFALLGALLLLVGLAGLWASRDEPAPVAAACPSPTASSSAQPSPAALPAPGQVRVVLLNGTSRQGLASVVAEQLRGRGFVVVGAGNAPSALAGPSVVTYSAGGQGAAEQLRRYVAGSRVAGAGPVASGAVQLVLGGDFRRLATPAEVLAAALPTPAPAAHGAPTAAPAAQGCP